MPETTAFTSIFTGLFDTDAASVISVSDFLLCLGVSILAGVLLALCSTVRSRTSKSFVVSLTLLPAVVCVIIMMVNGNIGTAVAVAGAFSLVRYRSAPGTAREITAIFIAMGAGLIAGMGYLGFSLLFTVILCAFWLLFGTLDLGAGRRTAACRTMNITIPEDLDYTGVFEDILNDYTGSHELTKVKTTNMGSMFRLTYDITLKDPSREKEMIDRLRCRNGNLEITVSRQQTAPAEL